MSERTTLDEGTRYSMGCYVCDAEVETDGGASMPEGWGFVFAPEIAPPFGVGGMGYHYACPDCKDDD